MERIETRKNSGGYKRWADVVDGLKKTASIPNAATISTPVGHLDIECMEITPERAEQFLAAMGKNRSPTRRNIKMLTGEMEAGSFRLTGQPLIFDVDGVMIDGQHRCIACIESGVPFWSLVVSGVPKDTFTFLDQGSVRTVGNMLSMDGKGYANVRGSALNYLIMYRQKGTLGEFYASRDLSRRQIAEADNDFPRLEESAMMAQKVYGALGGAHGLMTALHYAFAEKDRDLADLFFDALASGTGLSVGDPVYHLRARLITEATGKRKGVRASVADTAAAFINAWNAVRKGKTLRVIASRRGEAMPKIV